MEYYKQSYCKVCYNTDKGQDMPIKDKLELLCTLIDNYKKEYCKMSSMSKRLSIISIMVEALLLLIKLEQKVKEIDVKLSEDVAELDLDKWCNSEIL